jgi:F-type H+-transporting ATPase subunit alpha
MKQKQYQPLSVAEMGVSLFAANEGYIDDVDVDKVVSFEAALLSYMRSNKADLMANINETGGFGDDIANGIRSAIEDFKKTGSW